MSLLRAHGHPEADHYTLGRLFDEATLVLDRINREAATTAFLHQMAVSTVPNMGAKPEWTKSMAETFSRVIKRMTGG